MKLFREGYNMDLSVRQQICRELLGQYYAFTHGDHLKGYISMYRSIFYITDTLNLSDWDDDLERIRKLSMGSPGFTCLTQLWEDMSVLILKSPEDDRDKNIIKHFQHAVGTTIPLDKYEYPQFIQYKVFKVN